MLRVEASRTPVEPMFSRAGPWKRPGHCEPSRSEPSRSEAIELGRLFKQPTDWKFKSIRQLHERGEPQILLATFDCTGKGPGESTLVSEFLLRPLAFLP
jgi:hypothetical protein